ncbi:hypothetical protein BGX28_006889 [Mortierella sp. GBA30]|nr:hypothetical protein BGX28_006889 [Mortierella sp. GBA30]
MRRGVRKTASWSSNAAADDDTKDGSRFLDKVVLRDVKMVLRPSSPPLPEIYVITAAGATISIVLWVFVYAITAAVTALMSWTNERDLAVAERAVEAIVAELVRQGHQGTGPKQKVKVLAAVFQDQTEDLIW